MATRTKSKKGQGTVAGDIAPAEEQGSDPVELAELSPRDDVVLPWDGSPDGDNVDESGVADDPGYGTRAEAEAEKPEAEAPRFVPEDFEPVPVPRLNAALVQLLQDIEAFEDPQLRIDEFVAQLGDDEFSMLWTWAREITWIISGTAADPSAAREEALFLPAMMRDRVATDLASVDAMVESGLFKHAQLVKFEAKPDYEIVEGDGQLTLVDDAPVTMGPPPTLAMRTRDEGAQVAGAIRDRASDLMNLAKKAKELEQHREARHFENLAKALTLDLLPQLETQTTLPLDEHTPILTTLANSFGETVYAAFRQHCITSARPRDGESKEDAVERMRETLRDVEKILGKLPNFMAPTALEYFTAIAEEAQAAGYAQRTETPEYLVRKAVHGIRAAKQKEKV